jgi:hypothetical protein
LKTVPNVSLLRKKNGYMPYWPNSLARMMAAKLLTLY